jgi:hypothetical protein
MGRLAFIFRREDRIRPTMPLLALAYVAGKKPQRCAVVNYTPAGACVSSEAELPDHFTMHIIGSTTDRLCEVKWRDEGLVGVRYITARTMRRPKEAEPPADWGAVTLYPTG